MSELDIGASSEAAADDRVWIAGAVDALARVARPSTPDGIFAAASTRLGLVDGILRQAGVYLRCRDLFKLTATDTELLGVLAGMSSVAVEETLFNDVPYGVGAERIIGGCVLTVTSDDHCALGMTHEQSL